MHSPCPEGEWPGHLKIGEAAAAKTLVLACTYSALVSAGDPKFVKKWLRNSTLAPFSTVLWLKVEDMHCTTVRMDLRKCGDASAVTAVEVLLADSNSEEKIPALNEAYRRTMEEVSSQLFPGASFKEVAGVQVPTQNSFNDCCFHTVLYQAQAIEDRHGPPAHEWQLHAARLRAYLVFLVYLEMRSNGAPLSELTAARAEWNRALQSRKGKRPMQQAATQTPEKANKREHVSTTRGRGAGITSPPDVVAGTEEQEADKVREVSALAEAREAAATLAGIHAAQLSSADGADAAAAVGKTAAATARAVAAEGGKLQLMREISYYAYHNGVRIETTLDQAPIDDDDRLFLYRLQSDNTAFEEAFPDGGAAIADGGAATPASLERSGEGVDAALRSADMARCRLAVVHTRYWEAYRNLLKLVEFRSPRHLIPFFPGMILLFSLNAHERRKGNTELLMAVVLGICVLSCSEALARFPVEAQACDLASLCKRWGCNNTVQCLVLDKDSIRVASEVRNLAAGNLGLLRQINNRAGTARFCCSVDLGKTAMVRLSTGKMVHCTLHIHRVLARVHQP